jgi:hypothetical protein
VLNYSVLLKVEKRPEPYQSFYSDVFSGHIPKQPQKSSLGYNRGFRTVFILNASLAAFATLVVVSIVVVKQKNLSRGDEIELKEEVKNLRGRGQIWAWGREIGREIGGEALRD